MTRKLSALALLLALPLLARAAPAPSAIAVTGGKTDETNVVVKLAVPKGDAVTANVVELSSGATVPAQLTGAAQTDGPAAPQHLVFVVPKLKAGETIAGKLKTVNYVAAPPAFKFVGKKGEPTELVYGGTGGPRKVLQFFDLPRDPKDHYYTFKPFVNVYDPVGGTTMLTNTSSKAAKDGQYPHHRGLFFGFNKITYGDNQAADVWHGTNNVFSQSD